MTSKKLSEWGVSDLQWETVNADTVKRSSLPKETGARRSNESADSLSQSKTGRTASQGKSLEKDPPPEAPTSLVSKKGKKPTTKISESGLQASVNRLEEDRDDKSMSTGHVSPTRDTPSRTQFAPISTPLAQKHMKSMGVFSPLQG